MIPTASRNSNVSEEIKKLNWDDKAMVKINHHQMNVAAITIDGAFTTWCSWFLHAKQESETMMILTSVLANLGS